jgi:hypothetical protein
VRSVSFERFAGVCAILAAAAGFLYALFFIVVQNHLLWALFLMLSGLLSSAVLVAVYNRLRETQAAFALWALVLGIAGSVGSAIHGGYDLSLAINPLPTNPDLPSQVDPRGLLSFLVLGIALFIIGWLIRRGEHFPKGLGYLGYASAILLVILYLGRLIIFEASSLLILVPAVLNGFLVNPAFYLWLGVVLWSARRP